MWRKVYHNWRVMDRTQKLPNLRRRTPPRDLLARHAKDPRRPRRVALWGSVILGGRHIGQSVNPPDRRPSVDRPLRTIIRPDVNMDANGNSADVQAEVRLRLPVQHPQDGTSAHALPRNLAGHPYRAVKGNRERQNTFAPDKFFALIVTLVIPGRIGCFSNTSRLDALSHFHPGGSPLTVTVGRDSESTSNEQSE